MGHTFTNLLTHVVFSTKDREPSIGGEVGPRLFAYLGGVIRELGGMAVAVNGVEDHVHLLVTLPAVLSVAEALRVVKANSSRWVHETWPGQRTFGWQTGYAAFSVSRSNLDEVARYIANQQEHHRTMTFQEELIAFLNRHELAFDPRYIWK